MSEGDIECFELFREIRRVGARLSRERDDDLKVLQLTGSQSLALLYLEQNPKCQITDLSSHLEISHQAARTLVDRLRTKGLVDVVISDSDGRARSITLTDVGAEKCAEIRRVRLDTASHSLSSLSHEERTLMLSLLDKISRNLPRDGPSVHQRINSAQPILNRNFFRLRDRNWHSCFPMIVICKTGFLNPVQHQKNRLH